MACVNCNIELCYICDGDAGEGEDCCCKKNFFGDSSIFSTEKKIGQKAEPTIQELENKNPIGRPRMNPEDMIDAKRAGRDRARRTLPIREGAICEWANLKFAGGGIRPIIGCVGLPAGARHHGPDKSTVDNTRGVNLHLVCHKCHNRWHASNDLYYGKRPSDNSTYVPRADAGECKPHDPTSQATNDERFENELYWQTPKAKRIVETQVIEEYDEEDEEEEETVTTVSE